MNDYSYHRPTSLDEALELKHREPDARWIAGGTDLLVQLRSGRAGSPGALISLRGVDELSGIERGETFRIGAGTPLHELAADGAIATTFPALVDAIEVIGSRQIRNVATLGGNLCNASPGADAAPPLLVHDARVELRGPNGTRELDLEDFFQGPGSTALADDELLSAILIDAPATGTRTAFRRKGRVAMDIATASAAVLVHAEGTTIRTVRAAAGAVAPVPLRLKAVERLLTGADVTAELLQAAQRATMDEIAPITDIRATADYRRKLTGVLLRRALESVLPQVPTEVSA